MYGLIGKISSVPGKRDELADVLAKGLDKMPGCLSCVIAVDNGNPDAVWVTEIWDSEDSHKSALRLPHVVDAIRRATPLIEAFDADAVVTPVSGSGLKPGQRFDRERPAKERGFRWVAGNRAR